MKEFFPADRPEKYYANVFGHFCTTISYTYTAYSQLLLFLFERKFHGPIDEFCRSINGPQTGLWETFA